MAHEPLDLMTLGKKSVELSANVYTLTKTFPKDELNNLTRFLQESSMTVICDIGKARGFDCISHDELAHCLCKALGSTNQVQALLLVARKLGMGSNETLNEAELLSDEISKMLGSFIQTLQVPERKARS